MFHASRRRDFRAPGILEAPPAEKSVTPKCAETKLQLNGGQSACSFEEKSLLKARFLGSNVGVCGAGRGCIKFPANEPEKSALNPAWLRATEWSVSGITTIYQAF